MNAAVFVANRAASNALQVFGLLFCMQWWIALAGFPFLKDRPIGLIPVAAGIALAAVIGQHRVSRAVSASLLAWPAATFLTTVLATALMLRIAAVCLFPLEPMVDDAQFHRYAVSMLGGGPYGTRVYRAFFPPGMTFVLFGWYFIVGASWFAGKILNALLGVLLVWLVYDTARRHTSVATARVAAVLAAIMPTLVFYSATLGYEVLLACILVVIGRLAATDGGRPVSPSRVGCLGLLIGAGSLANPLCLLLPAVLGIWWLVLEGRRTALARVLAVALVGMVVVAPWTWRNYRVFGAFVPVSTNGGITLYAANNERATGLAMAVDPPPGVLDEVTRDRLSQKRALAWMAANPLDVVRLAVRKCVYTWGTASSIMSVVSTDRIPPLWEAACSALLNTFWAMLAVWVSVATLRTRVWRHSGLAPPFLVLAYVFGLHLVFEALSRHQIPVLPPLLIAAAAGLTRSISGVAATPPGQ